MLDLFPVKLRTKILVLLIACISSVSGYAATVIYVANTDSQDISVFQLDGSSLQTKWLQTVHVGGAVMPMALSPDKKYLYAALRSEPYLVLILAINPLTGTLSQNASAVLVDNMANISVDKQGRYLFAASYGGNKISVQSIDKNGIPENSPEILSTGAHPHQITASSDNKFVYVSLLGEDRLDYYRIQSPRKNASKNFLMRVAEPAAKLPAGSGPRHFVFSADEKFLYLLDELSANLHVLKRNTKTGKTTHLESHGLLPMDTKQKAWAADIHTTPDGKFIYATERNSSTLVGFKIDNQSGRLTPIGSWNTEQQPRAFAISPDGRFLAAVGQKSNRMTLYSIHPDTGKLQPVNHNMTGMNPSWVEIVALPTQSN